MTTDGPTYPSETPRIALAGSALLLMVATFATLVAAPAMLDGRADATAMLAKAQDVARAPIEVAIVPSRIEVIGRRDPNVAWALQDASAPCRPQG